MTYAETLLGEVQQGMVVLDREGKKVGIVTLAFPGNGDKMANTGIGSESIPPEVRDEVASEHLPLAMEERLLSYGFVKLSTGDLALQTRFATPEQVAGVDPDHNEIHLSIDGNELLKG